MKALGLHPEWAVFRDMWRGFISGGMMLMMMMSETVTIHEKCSLLKILFVLFELTCAGCRPSNK